MYRTILIGMLIVLAAAAHSGVSQAALIQYWRFDDGAGASATNSISGGLTGTLANVYGGTTGANAKPIWTSGRFDGGLEFSGSTTYSFTPNPGSLTGWALNYVNIPSAGGLNLVNSTLSMWVRWNGIQPLTVCGNTSAVNNLGTYGAILGLQQSYIGTWIVGLNAPSSGGTAGDPNSAAGLRLVNGAVTAWPAKPPTGADVGGFGMPQYGSNYTPPGNEWVNIVMTVTDTSYSLYQNGTLLRTVTGLSLNRTFNQPLTIGAYYDVGGYYGPSNSTIDDVGIFNAVLSVGKVKAIYNATLLPGLDGYDLDTMNQLFGLYDDVAHAPVSIGSLTWEYISGLSGHNPGDAWFDGGFAYVQLGASDGVRAIPEPGTLAMLAAGLVGLLACAWKKRK
jgi:hypothetical protein